MFSGAITELEEEDVPIVTPEKKQEVDTSQEVLSTVGEFTLSLYYVEDHISYEPLIHEDTILCPSVVL